MNNKEDINDSPISPLSISPSPPPNSKLLKLPKKRKRKRKIFTTQYEKIKRRKQYQKKLADKHKKTVTVPVQITHGLNFSFNIPKPRPRPKSPSPIPNGYENLMPPPLYLGKPAVTYSSITEERTASIHPRPRPITIDQNPFFKMELNRKFVDNEGRKRIEYIL